MVRFDSDKDKARLGLALRADVTEQDILQLVNFGRHIRGRCRNNTALVNYLNSMFTGRFRFALVDREYGGRVFKGLQITHIRSGAMASDSEEGE